MLEVLEDPVLINMPYGRQYASEGLVQYFLFRLNTEVDR